VKVMKQSIVTDDAGGYEGFETLDPSAMKEIDVLQDSQVIRTVTWSTAPDSSMFVYGTTSRALKFAEASAQRGISLLQELPDYHAGSIYAISWHRHGDLLATGSNDKQVQVTKLTVERDGGFSHSTPVHLQGHTGTVRCVEWCDSLSPSCLLSAGAGDCAVRLWDFSRKSCLAMLQGHTDHIQALARTHDSPRAATGGKDGQVRLWDLRQQASSRVLACQGEEVLSLHFNPSETMLAAGFASSCCNVWELRMGKVMHRFQHHQHQCRSVEYSPDGRWLVTASFDGTIAFVDVVDGSVAAILTGHEDRVVQARPHPQLPWTLSCSVDKTVRLWG